MLQDVGGARLALSILSGLAAFVVGYWIPGAFLPNGWQGVCGAVIGLATAGLVWAGIGSRSPLLRGAMRGAAWGGLIGFAGGFFGPMLLTPDANQGPMLGLFFTGPGGVVLGGLAGLAIAAGKPG